MEIAHDDFGTEFFQGCRSIVFAMHHGADSKSERDRFFNGRPAGVSGCARDQYFAAHFMFLFWRGEWENGPGCCGTDCYRDPTRVHPVRVHWPAGRMRQVNRLPVRGVQ
jgi:hypothetical protein